MAMDLSGKKAGPVTPVKEPQSNRSKISDVLKHSENSNPNVTSPALKCCNSPAIKSASKSQKSASKNPNPVASPSPRNKIRGRKFVVAKKNSRREKENSSTLTCKCKFGGKSQKCLCVAYQSLRASQEEFFRNPSNTDDQGELESLKNSDRAETKVEENEDKITTIQNPNFANGCEGDVEEDDFRPTNKRDSLDTNEIGPVEIASLNIKRRRDKLLEEARENVPEPGSGRVLHLVKTFEKLLTIPKSKESDLKDQKESEDTKKGVKWALPGLPPPPPSDPGTEVFPSSFCPSDFFLTSESLGLDFPVSSSLDSSQGSYSISVRTSDDVNRSRRNSSGSSGNFGVRHWKRRQLKGTRQRPFKLITEQRGRHKEEEFVKKVHQMIAEEDKLRIPVAQGLPWTTDEPENLVRPPVKEITRPVDLVLHSDVRAVERAEFDHQVAEKMSLVEQYRAERERQQKAAEEEEIRRLRKELVPRAQPMPYFDRPFLPRRSVKQPTIPKEPKFHVPEHKKIKCCMSWNDMYALQQ